MVGVAHAEVAAGHLGICLTVWVESAAGRMVCAPWGLFVGVAIGSVVDLGGGCPVVVVAVCFGGAVATEDS